MKTQNPFEPTVKNGIEYQAGWILSEKSLHSIEGNQMAIIEAIGLPEKQEKAVKSQVRQALYRITKRAIFLSSEEVAEHGNEKGDSASPIPFSVIEGTE